MRIAIFFNPETNPENSRFANALSCLLAERGVSVSINPDPTRLEGVDFALTAGGDGTVLYAANLLSETQIPILGVNFGHRGYLCQVDHSQIGSALDQLLAGHYTLVRKTRVQASISQAGASPLLLDALNEIVVGGINRTVSLAVIIDSGKQRIEAEVIGDGLIVSTQTGSTAYNLNAGGAMLLTDAYSILANNAHFHSAHASPLARSMVVSTDTTITIRNLSHNSPFVIADGINETILPREDVVSIKRSVRMNDFVTFD